MRSLPFKMIGLIGLNDGDFPRHIQASVFDLIAKHPKKGDRARRDDDRYLFLEAILSARNVLYLSFVGKDIRTDETRAPSTLINELVDSVAEMTDISSIKILSEQWITHHPLQAFSRRYFSGSLKSSRRDYADALNGKPTVLGDFFRQPDNEINIDTSKPIEQKAFLQFWRNPVRSYLRDHLQWETPHTGIEWDSAEPFEIQKKLLVSDAYIEARRNGRSFDELANRLRAQSLLPTGELGEWIKRDFAMQVAGLDSRILHSCALPERSGVLASVSGCLNYRLSHDYDIGQVIDMSNFLNHWNESGQLSSADKIELLLQHLIFCAATPEAGRQPESRQTYLIKLPEILTLPAIEQTTANKILSLWISTYQQGKHAPQPFFPRVQLAAANKLFFPKKQDAGLDYEGARREAAKIYHQGFHGFAQADYPEVKLVYGRNPEAEPPYLTDLFMNLTENLFTGLSECLKVLSPDNKQTT